MNKKGRKAKDAPKSTQGIFDERNRNVSNASSVVMQPVSEYAD